MLACPYHGREVLYVKPSSHDKFNYVYAADGKDAPSLLAECIKSLYGDYNEFADVEDFQHYDGSDDGDATAR